MVALVLDDPGGPAAPGLEPHSEQPVLILHLDGLLSLCLPGARQGQTVLLGLVGDDFLDDLWIEQHDALVVKGDDAPATPIMLVAMPTQPSEWVCSVSSRSAVTGRSSGVASLDFRAGNRASLQISRTMSVLLVALDGCRDGLRRQARPRFGGMHPAPGVLDHLRAGEPGQHGGHIVGKGQAVTQHKDAHKKNSFRGQPGKRPQAFLSRFVATVAPRFSVISITQRWVGGQASQKATLPGNWASGAAPLRIPALVHVWNKQW